MKKECRELDLKPGLFSLADWRPRRHSYGEFNFILGIFNEIIQHLLHSNVAKAESYLRGCYHNEWLELTYYKETLPIRSAVLARLDNVDFFSLLSFPHSTSKDRDQESIFD